MLDYYSVIINMIFIRRLEMDFTHTKARNSLLTLSCVAILAMYSNDRTVKAETVELDVTNVQNIESETNNEAADLSEIFELKEFNEDITGINNTELDEAKEVTESESEEESIEDPELHETKEEVTELESEEESIEIPKLDEINQEINEPESEEENSENTVIDEIKEENTQLESEEKTPKEVKWTINDFNKSDFLLQVTGLSDHKLILRDEKGTFISQTESEYEGLFSLEIPSGILYQQLFIEIFNLEDKLIEKIEVIIHDEETPEEDKLDLNVDVKNDLSKEEVSETEDNRVKEVELAVSAPVNLMKKTQMLSNRAVSLKGKTYYYIQSGDTLNSLAKHFGVTSLELQSWNNISNANNIYVNQLISVDGKNVYDEINKENKIFGSSAEFVKHLSSYASKVATEYGLYPSVMVAQSILESGYGQSGLSKVGNNLFGIKGTYKGNSIVMRTWEEVNNEVIWINAHFRLYPSFAESLVDNAELLRNGLDYAPDFYKGTWVESTNSYKDSTEWLTGRYATDSNYGSKLNNLIETWDLVKYDPKKSAETNIIRHEGSNREAVAVNVAKSHFSNAKKVIIVNRDKYTDAISATNISQGMYPILYTREGSIDQATLDLLKQLPLDEIYVLGGIKSVQDKVIDILRKQIGVTVTRIDGRDRFEVNANAISLKYKSNGHVVIASGDIYTDALYGVSFADTINSPVLLSKKDRLTEHVLQLIKALGVKKATLIGGTNTLSSGVEAQLRSMGIVFDRIAGANRYSGSVAVAERSYKNPQSVVIASGEVFSDALVSAPLAQKLNAPILLVRKDRLAIETTQYLKDKKLSLKNIYIQGGTRTITAANQVSIKAATK